MPSRAQPNNRWRVFQGRVLRAQFPGRERSQDLADLNVSGDKYRVCQPTRAASGQRALPVPESCTGEQMITNSTLQ